MDSGLVAPGVSAHTALSDKEINGVIDHSLQSVRDGHLYNFEAWKRLLAANPDQALKLLKKVWTGVAGEDQFEGLAFDGTYIYAGTFTSPAKVIKIDPSTMTTVLVFTADTDEDVCAALTFDGTYIYAGLRTFPAKVIQIDPATMTRVATWEGAVDEDDCEALTVDGTYIYAGLDTGLEAKVIKIDPATMTTVSTWTGLSDGVWEVSCYALTFDGTYIYAALRMTPARVIKIDPSTMTTVATWEGAVGENNCQALAFDGTYIYAGHSVSPGKVVKIDPATMTTVATWEGASGENMSIALTYDGSYIYAGLWLSPMKLIKIDPSTMVTVSVWTGAGGENQCYALTFDGSYIYAALSVSPAKLIGKIMPEPSPVLEVVQSDILDLSGGATDLVTFFAESSCQLIGYSILYTEASSADAGVAIRVGRYQDGVALDDDYFDISTSEVSKNMGYSKHFASGDLTNSLIAAGDTVTVGTAGGKTDSGEVMLILQIAKMGV